MFSDSGALTIFGPNNIIDFPNLNIFYEKMIDKIEDLLNLIGNYKWVCRIFSCFSILEFMQPLYKVLNLKEWIDISSIFVEIGVINGTTGKQPNSAIHFRLMAQVSLNCYFWAEIEWKWNTHVHAIERKLSQ